MEGSTPQSLRDGSPARGASYYARVWECLGCSGKWWSLVLRHEKMDKKRVSPRGTLTTPPSNPQAEADGVILPSSGTSIGKVSEKSGSGEAEVGKSEWN